MDIETYGMMNYFVKKYIMRKDLYVCDVGSYNINGTFKSLFKDHKYIGIDILKGPNVDIVTDLYRYPFCDEAFDVVISGSTVEHVKNIFKWIVELQRITKKNGLVCLIAPALHQKIHRYPVDCWRIYPDGIIFLLEEMAGLKLEEVKISKLHDDIECLGIGRKKI